MYDISSHTVVSGTTIKSTKILQFRFKITYQLRHRQYTLREIKNFMKRIVILEYYTIFINGSNLIYFSFEHVCDKSYYSKFWREFL